MHPHIIQTHRLNSFLVFLALFVDVYSVDACDDIYRSIDKHHLRSHQALSVKVHVLFRDFMFFFRECELILRIYSEFLVRVQLADQLLSSRSRCGYKIL